MLYLGREDDRQKYIRLSEQSCCMFQIDRCGIFACFNREDMASLRVSSGQIWNLPLRNIFYLYMAQVLGAVGAGVVQCAVVSVKLDVIVVAAVFDPAAVGA